LLFYVFVRLRDRKKKISASERILREAGEGKGHGKHARPFCFSIERTRKKKAARTWRWRCQCVALSRPVSLPVCVVCDGRIERGRGGGGLVRRLDAKAKRVGSLFGFLKGVLFVLRGACARARGGIILRREELEEEAGLLSFLFHLSRDPFFNTALSLFLSPPPEARKGCDARCGEEEENQGRRRR